MCVILHVSWARVTGSSQECKDVKDKLEELIPWLTKLLESLAKVDPKGDQQETERRTELARSALNQKSLTPQD